MLDKSVQIAVVFMEIAEYVYLAEHMLIGTCLLWNMQLDYLVLMLLLQEGSCICDDGYEGEDCSVVKNKEDMITDIIDNFEGHYGQ